MEAAGIEITGVAVARIDDVRIGVTGLDVRVGVSNEIKLRV